MKSRFSLCLNLDFVFYSKAISTDKNHLSQKSYQQVFCLFSIFSSDSFKGFFRFYKRDFISLKKHVKTAFCFYWVGTFPFIRLQESPDKESPSVPAEHERK